MKKVAFTAILGALFHLGGMLYQTQASRIAYICEEGFDICTINPDGTNRQRVTRTPEITERWPTWSPDGKWIAFAPFIPSKLVMTDLKGDNETLLIEPYQNSSRPAWSPDGTKIARANVQKLHILDIITGEEKKIWPLGVNTHGYRDPAWSPDGREIAFASLHGNQRDIYVTNIEGDQVRRLTNHPTEDHAPAWSPDGRRIAFYSNRDHQAGIFVVDADGANLKRLTIGSHDYPTWSPDGTRIAIWVAGDPPGIGIMRASGRGLKVIAEGTHPSWQRVDVAAAVEPMGKLPSIWGLLKSKIRLPQFYLNQ